MSKYLLLPFLFISIHFSGQNPNFSYYVDTLCSDYFKGRGYVDNGHLKAANFLVNEFEKINLEPLGKTNYIQSFKIDVNTFPYKIDLKLDGHKLIPGKDFMIDPHSCAVDGSFKVIKTNLKNWKSLLNSKSLYNQSIVSIDVSNITNRDTISLYNEVKNILKNHFPIFWITSNKLQWSVADYVSKFPIININREALNKNFKEVDIHLQNKFINDLNTQNVIGKAKGKGRKSIIISAHYDHLGMMGDVKFPGANDNASGISLLLNLATYYSKIKSKYNIIFICFGAEEAGLKGSKYFTNNPLIDLKKVQFLINLDIVGTGEDGIAIVNALEQEKAAKQIGKINSQLNAFKKIKIRGQAPNSDHYWFSVKKVPSIFIYTMGGIKAYHDPFDKSETLPLNKIEDLYNLLIEFIAEI